MPPQSIVFNRELSMDLLWLDKVPVLHVVDTHTAFKNAEFIRGKSSKELWESFLRCWVTLFIGYPNTLRLDQDLIIQQ